MRYGFYDAADMERSMECVICAGDTVDAYQYLHGCCDDFALALNDVFGYEIVLWLGKNRDFGGLRLIHAFCSFEHEDTIHYIDVRGVTDGINDIVSEFDYWEEPKFITCTRSEAIKALRSIGIMSLDDDEPYKIIRQFLEYYLLNKRVTA